MVTSDARGERIIPHSNVHGHTHALSHAGSVHEPDYLKCDGRRAERQEQAQKAAARKIRSSLTWRVEALDEGARAAFIKNSTRLRENVHSISFNTPARRTYIKTQAYTPQF
jgi:hypothetical protein